MVIILGALALILAAIVSAWLYTRKVDDKIRQHFPPSGQLLPVTGGTIHWQESGSGPPVVLIHGLSGNLHNFSGIEDALAKHYRVYAVDRPGSGHATRLSATDADFAVQATMLLEWMSHIKVNRALIVGHSMGGAVALRMALLAPEKCAGLALLCPLTAPLPDASGAMRRLYIPGPPTRRLLSATLATPYRLRNAKRNLDAIFAPDTVPADFALKYGGALSMHSNACYEAINDVAVMQGSLRQQSRLYHTIRCPTGVLFGAKDRILNPGYHTQCLARALPNLITEHLTDRGHMIPMTAPTQCVEFINDIARRAFPSSHPAD
ncbi:alpha/beta fold hydrolase [Alteromonas sp. ASW11-19]|uniref:Alpha/beta fold hydrolase n=1 Tax=Alteromonas salexigens TaxID=2982530 RepID=A0ABT2VJL0_9ALTE|nr:alpha/beta fold hydrolase [Alteromonas salexigens]MCU7553422.1 alpha/beta fold hydrolase [Alteromonas salexigens]